MNDDLAHLRASPDADRAAFEVSQHADGTLDPARRGEVAEALRDDPDLRAMRDDFAAIDRLLRRTPDPAVLDRVCGDVRSRVMATVLADDAGPIPMPTPAAKPAGRRWLPTALAAAAALAVGISIGLLNQRDAAAPAVAVEPGLAVEGPALATAAPASVVEVAGPALAPAGPGTLEVAGIAPPAAAYSPGELTADGTEIVRSPFPDYAELFNASVVVERPSRVVVAAAAD